MVASLVRAGLFIALAVGACAEAEGRAPCGPDEVRIASRCVFAGATDATATSDATVDAAGDATTLEEVDPDTAVAGDADATATTATDATVVDGADATVGLTLPFYVSDHFVMSGYMGSGEVAVTDCGGAMPVGSGAGACWKITWTPATGTTADWVGFYLQYPENNWGALPGLAIPPGAGRVRFVAWGAVGGESANFGVGISTADGFQVETGYGLLEAAPEERVISLAGKTYSDVAGGFAWFLNNPGAATSVTIFLDDVRWEASE